MGGGDCVVEKGMCGYDEVRGVALDVDEINVIKFFAFLLVMCSPFLCEGLKGGSDSAGGWVVCVDGEVSGFFTCREAEVLTDGFEECFSVFGSF